MLCGQKYNWDIARCVSFGARIEQQVQLSGVDGAAAEKLGLEMVMKEIHADKLAVQHRLRRDWAVKKILLMLVAAAKSDTLALLA